MSSGGRIRDVILGPESVVLGPVALLDWERAPLANVFLGHLVDDDYELELDDGRTVEGTVLARELLRCVGHELRELDDGTTCLRREAQIGEELGEWIAEPSRLDGGLILRELDDRSRLSSPIEVDLDPVQRHAVEL
ncbi:MAG TPA: hypothetical protein VK034_22950, partial [Enhygromyxa sp.]|nr:hypothetical protein [Enhygromyxa sp.]